jgi:hypothetical protein
MNQPAMLQNVNLYLPEFRRKKHWLDAEKMLLVTGAVAALLVVATAIDYIQLVGLRGDLAEREQQHQQVLAATNTLLDQYGVQTEDPALLENIRELERDLQSKQALLQFLEGRELGNTEGFSEYLADLARYYVDGMSLTDVTLTNGGRSLALEGQVSKAELVTLYLQNLNKGRSFAGKSFDALQIDQDEIVVASTVEGTPATELAVWNFQAQTLD